MTKSYCKVRQRGKPQVLDYVIIHRGQRLSGRVDSLAEAEATATLRAYIGELEAAQLHPSTVDKYHHCLKAYQDWLCGEPISAQSAKAFLNYLRQKDFSSSTLRAYYHALRPFLAYLGIPLQIKFKKQHRLPAYHSPSEVKAILDVIRQRDDAWNKLKQRDVVMVLTLAYTGVRRAELLSLTVRDINFRDRMVRVLGKGDKERVIPIAPVLFTALQDYTKGMQPGDRLFPMQPRRLWAIISRYANKAGVENFHPHSFRHYFATQLVEGGTFLKVVQELLGHASIETTAVYLDILPKHLSNAVSSLPDLTEGNNERA